MSWTPPIPLPRGVSEVGAGIKTAQTLKGKSPAYRIWSNGSQEGFGVPLNCLCHILRQPGSLVERQLLLAWSHHQLATAASPGLCQGKPCWERYRGKIQQEKHHHHPWKVKKSLRKRRRSVQTDSAAPSKQAVHCTSSRILFLLSSKANMS